MPKLDRVRAEILEAVLEVVGPYGRSKAQRIADHTIESFKAHAWAVFTAEEMDQVEDVPRVPLDDDLGRLGKGVRVPEMRPGEVRKKTEE